MDNLEAIEQLKDLIEDRKSFDKDKIWDRDIEALKIGIAAIEKRIPKLVECSKEYYCPECRCTVCFGEKLYYKFCPYCGQALEWGEDDGT